MSKINFNDISRKLAAHGEIITIRNYSGTSNQYDSDQNPQNTYTSGTTYATILEPNYLDIKMFGGLITSGTKKVVMSQDTSLNVSDDIILSSGTTRVIQIQPLLTRKVAFVNELSP